MKTWAWIVLIAVIVVVSVVLCVVFFTQKEEGGVANVYSDGELVYSVDLNAVTEPYEKVIETEYGTNTLRIEKGRICVVDADCNGRECVHTGYISDSSAPIVCLPHKLVIKIEKESDVDTVSK